MQGLQQTPTPQPLNYVEVANPMAEVHLESNVGTRTFLFAPGLPEFAPGVPDLTGTFWNMMLANSCTTFNPCPAPQTCTDDEGGGCVLPCTSDSQCTTPGAKCVLGSCSDVGGAIPLYIAGMERDRGLNSSRAPSNDDIYLYTVYFREPGTGRWSSLCPTDDEGKARAMAIPLDPTDWISQPSPAKLAFACTASGVAAKCARTWGYKPWVSATPDLYYNSCLIAARAAYCQDDKSFTRDGTPVDLFDAILNPPEAGNLAWNRTVGLSVNPFDKKPMLHEEYQISLNDRVISAFTPAELNEMDGAVKKFLAQLHTSGLQSTRYPDLDPGRSCDASPYIDRCTSPGVCTRAGNRPPGFYDTIVAVNSPRHCTHRENEQGDPMIPSCSACTARICEIDPTCCGDAGGNLFPASLVWDDRCTALREQVCRSTPAGGSTQNLWPLGELAVGKVGQPVKVLHGAVGAFEGIVVDAGVQYAEGWACDPDFAAASSPIQISVGGPLGADGAKLLTATADGALAQGWRDDVAAECGGGDRHGFHVALPPEAAGHDVFVYGIDLDVPGAPFSLLRGGKKTAPGAGAPPPQSPRAAIYTGWIEPEASDNYLFAVDAGSGDKYRLWVNGAFVAGNWKDPVTVPPTPGAFTIDPPVPPPTPFLQKGIRYAVRVEYLRPDTTSASSHLQVTWARPRANPPGGPLPIPTTALYPMAQSTGNGLQGTYFPNIPDLSALPQDSTGSRPERTFSAVDFVWDEGNRPIVGKDSPAIAGLSVADSFAVRFEGQLVPPISGDYTFSVETDGVARVFVNGVQIVTVDRRSDAPPNRCAHDICAVGPIMDATCEQNDFCVSEICAADPACCDATWDARCVEEVQTSCLADPFMCASTPGVLPLNAGWKYDVRVVYQHQGSLPDQTVRAAKLRLMWSLAGSPRDVVPAARLFAATDAPAPRRGTGVNAAYFTDAVFRDEFFDRVEPSLAFLAGSAPVATRAGSMICPQAGAAVCGAAPLLGAPALAGPEMVPAGGGAMALVLHGGGAVPNATLTVFEVKQDGTLAALGAPAMSVSAGGAFQTAPLTVQRRKYVLVAKQTLGGQDSALSEKLFVEVRDASGPPPPTMATASAAPDGTVTVGGTAGGSNGVTVTVKVAGSSDPFSSTAFTAQGDGSWGGTFSLPPGTYEVTVTQTSSSGHTGDPAQTLTIDVPVPPLTVDAPADGLAFTCPTRTCLVTVSGGGASASLGSVIVADGDSQRDADGNVVAADRFFVDLPTQPPAVTPGPDGRFTGQVALDQGRHRLKVFQRSNGLDGAGQPRTVIVRPPAAAIVVQSPVDGAVIDPAVTVSGSGPPRQGFRGAVGVYQVPRGASACPTTAGPIGSPGVVLLGEGPLRDTDGGFLVPITVQGVGRQCLAVSNTQSSLSGAGSAESDLSSVFTVRVRPQPPTITKPLRTGTLQFDSLTVAVEGTALAGSTVKIYAERAAGAAVVQSAPAPAGTFAATLALPAAGTYRLTATATVDGAESARSAPPVVIAVGDVIPPSVKVSNPTDPARKPVREIPVTAANDAGADFNVGPWVTAVDPSPTGGAAVPIAASQIVCLPAAAATTHFALGVTEVTCTATDAAGNKGSTTFRVVVRSTSAPVLVGANLTAEALSPAGAPVNYQIAGTGFIADCAPPGSATPQSCSAWRPASTGLTVDVGSVAMDRTTGDLYASVNDGGSSRLFKSATGGATWQELPAPGVGALSQIVVQSGPPATITVVPALDPGLRISRDGGQSWATSLAGIRIASVAQDPRAGAHLLAANLKRAGTPAQLYETRDAGVTWTPSGGGLPDEQIEAVAIDPVNADRMYLSIGDAGGDGLVRIFRRVAGGTWRERPVLGGSNPFFAKTVHAMFVAPSVATTCPTGDPFPTVFAGFVYSCDGGDNWQPIQSGNPLFVNFDNVAFDRNLPGKVFAASSGMFGGFVVSSDEGRSWAPGATGDPIQMKTASLVQDPTGAALYAGDQLRGIIRSQDGGQTWTAITAGLPSSALAVLDVAADPADPAIAYLAFGQGGVLKTTNGGQSWEAKGQFNFAGHPFIAETVLVHPLARDVVLAGAAGRVIAQPSFSVSFSWGLSPDAGTTWAPLVDSTGASFAVAALAADPSTAGGWLATATFGASPSLRWPTGGGEQPFDRAVESIARMQMVPDARRTVVASSLSSSGGGRTVLFSFSDLLAGVSPPPFVDTGLIGPANVVYDGSDGTHRLYAAGRAVGRDPNLLYRATVDGVRAGLLPAQWEELRGDNVFPAFETQYPDPETKREPFATLMIDPVSAAGGGQTMYTLGSGDTLWVSADGGHSWRRDDTAPGSVASAWLSPVDGALYATVDGGPTAPPVLWKRLTSSGIFPGARLVRSDLRVTCQGPAGFAGAITPGSTFPIGDTVLSCSATDVFGNVTTRSFTVSVRDTRPPALVAPPDITLTTGCTSSQNIGAATATDVVSPPVTITSNRPTIFKAGTTVVTYTARDARGNTATATQRVTVVLNTDSSCCPTGTNVIRGTAGNDTLNGTSGRDCILGLGGQDTINGNGGDDVISGGDGDDVINGGDGNDVVFGNAGQDSLTGGLGNDTLDGGDGDDVCRGGDGNDVLSGGPGQDQLFGENNDDQLFGDDGDDRLDGGPGNDMLNGGAGNDTCVGGTGTNTLASCNP